MFSTTFTDTPKVWAEFSKKRMANNMNIFVLAIKKGTWIKKSGEEMTNKTSVLHNCPYIVIGCLTAAVTDHFVVVNALAVRDDKLFVSLEDPSTATKDAVDVTRWHRRGVGIFTLKFLVAHIYVVYGQKVLPLLLQVHEQNKMATDFYDKNGFLKVFANS